jgi:hypothetical protein
LGPCRLWMGMGPVSGKKDAKSDPRSGFGRELDAERKYFARIVSLDEIWRVLDTVETPDSLAAWVAHEQLHLITTRQAYASGLTGRALTTRCKNGLLHRVHKGAYLHGQPPFLPGAREFADRLTRSRPP